MSNIQKMSRKCGKVRKNKCVPYVGCGCLVLTSQHVQCSYWRMGCTPAVFWRANQTILECSCETRALHYSRFPVNDSLLVCRCRRLVAFVADSHIFLSSTLEVFIRLFDFVFDSVKAFCSTLLMWLTFVMFVLRYSVSQLTFVRYALFCCQLVRYYVFACIQLNKMVNS